MRLGEILKTAQRGTFEFHALLGALAQVGHAQAQAALREAVSSRMNEWNEASSILIAMAQMHRPDQETLRFFEKIVDDKHQPRLGSIAGLALGAAAKNLNQESIVRRFESELQSTQDTSDIRHLLLVLGNAGSQQALPTVLTYTEHPDPLVRANAALAMRFNTGTQAHDAILSLATRDSNEAVRREALHALAYQPTALGDLQTIAHLARSDTDFSVAQAAMELLAQHRAYQTLEDIAEHAATQKRRDAAMTLWRGSLQSSPSNPVAST
jgi:HEAT repeat protein